MESGYGGYGAWEIGVRAQGHLLPIELIIETPYVAGERVALGEAHVRRRRQALRQVPPIHLAR